jgi:class 3 adenylate cyclase/tetratricopeptide (TPR) repeat protein
VPEGARFCPACGHSLAVVATEGRRVVTVLFADMVGFTTLAEYRDPEHVKRFVDAAFEGLVADVERFGGQVDKVLGDAIVALFGAPIAHEDDAERAVRAGLAMHSTMRRFVAQQPEVTDVALRIGINTGEVLVGTLARTDYTAMGDVVNTASRLQGLAPPGGVLVGDATRMLCSDAIRFEPHEPALLRGREQIEHAWLAVGTVAPAANRRRRTEITFVGRTTERTLLQSITDLIATGRCAIVSVVGEAGIGKSRLVDEAVAALKASTPGVTVIHGQCAPYGEPNVWWPIASGLASGFGLQLDQPADEVREIATASAAAMYNLPTGAPAVHDEVEALLHLLGHPSELDSLDTTGARDALYGALIRSVRMRSALGPVVVWIDDLQWAHPLLRELLELMARALADCPLLIVTAYRPGDEDDWPPPVERALTLKLPIGPLDECDTAALVEAVAGRRPATDLIERLYDRSGGNPLFLTELAMLTSVNGDDDVDVALPGTLRALIAARLDQLVPPQRAVIDNAAILGTEGPVAALAEFADALGQVFDEGLVEDLVAAGLLEVEGRRWQFRSDVVREVAYQTLTKQARAQRHAGVATHLAALGKVPLDDLAHHAATAAELLQELGTVPGVPATIVPQAVDLLAQAARQSYEIGAFPRGVACSQRALGLAGEDAEARRALRLLHASGLVELRALDSARTELQELLEDLAGADDPVAEGETHRLLGVVEQLDGDLVAARESLGRAVEIFRQLGDDRHLATALRARGFAEIFGGSLADAEWYLGEADAIYERVGDVRGRAWVRQHRAWVAFLSGDHAGAEARLAGSIATFDGLGDRSGANWARGLLAFVMYFERRFGEAEELAQEVLEEARRWGDDWGAAMMLTLGSNLRLWTGRFAEAVQYGDKALTAFRRLGDRFGAIQALAPLNRARVALGRLSDAERGAEELLALADAFGDMAYPVIAAAGVAMHSGQGERTVELASDAIDRVASTGSNVDEGLVLLSMGHVLSGKPDDALATLLDVDVAVSPFALAARALANAMIGDHDAAIADADAIAGSGEMSYFDRMLATVAGAVAATAAGRDDAGDRLEMVHKLLEECDDVVIASFARETIHRFGVTTGEGSPHALTAGWRCVVDQLTGAAA